MAPPDAPDRALESGDDDRRSLGPALSRFAPGIVLVIVALVTLLRNGVTPGAVAAFAAYWTLCLILPGTLMARALLGARSRLVDDVLIGAVTGLTAEIAMFLLLRTIGLGELARWWFLVPISLFAVVPRLRRHWLVRSAQPVGHGWAWAMTAVAGLVVMGIERGWYRPNALPPDGGGLHRDAWWHLAIVHELFRPGPAQIPQVAGEPFKYHYNAHAHMAVASRITGIDPDIILLRLWVIPVALLAVGLMAVLAMEVARVRWAGPLAAFLTMAALSGGYLWRDFSILSNTPLRLASPSQLLAMPVVLAAAWMLIRIVRGVVSHRDWIWLALVAVVGAGSKPTVIPTLLAGTLLAALVLVVVNRRIPRTAVIAVALLGAAQLWSMLFRRGAASGDNFTVFGTLKSLEIYRTVTGDTTRRGVNDGLLLDSLDDRAALLAAGVTILWLLGSHAVHLAGLVALPHPRIGKDPASWWLVGSLAAGWLVIAVLDLSSFGQLYFFHIALPFGVVLTVWALAEATRPLEPSTRSVLVAGGVAIGVVTALVSAAITSAASERPSFGVLDQAVTPLLTVSVVGVVVVLVWRQLRVRAGFAHGGLAVGISIVLGISGPTAIDGAAATVVRWTERPSPVAYTPEQLEYISPAEQEAMIWLHENSAPSDIVATNSQCLPPTDDEAACNAIGFWVGGLSGRRVVLEGWGYTPPAHAAHGVDGKHRNRQPPPWPDRYALSQAALEAPTPDVLTEIRTRYGATWLVGVERAGPIAPELDDLADRAFDNGEVVIFRLRD